MGCPQGSPVRFVSIGLSKADRVLVVAYEAGTNVIFLEPELAKIFKDSDSVNRVLRLLLRLAKENVSTDRPV